jgi:biopolymer transport protein ExbB
LVDAIRLVLIQWGATWVLWLLGLLSVLSVAVIVERAFTFRALAGDIPALARALDARLAAGALQGASDELAASRAVAARIAAAGLRLADRGPTAVDMAMRSATALERGRLEQHLALLGSLGNNAPFVGLFGTVVGVIHAFEHLGHAGSDSLPTVGAGSPAAVGQVASQMVMTGVAEALVTTAVGILVALPAVAAYNYFQRRMSTILGGSEVLSNLALAYLADTSSSTVPPSSPAQESARGG